MNTALIFDIDGTLWDSRRPVAIAWNQAILDETGTDRGLNAENIRCLFGKPMDEIAASLFPEEPKERQLALGELCFARENEYLAKDPGTLFPGVRETLEKLAERYPLYIVSNCQSGYIDVFLSGTRLAPLFKGHLCFGDTGLSKGQTIRRLMERYGITNAVYVGDTKGDADACTEAQIPMIYAAYGFGEVANPERTIRSFSELSEIYQ